MDSTNGLSLGVIATSQKTDERRLPIHPLHFERIDENFRKRMMVETGYGLPCGIDDEQLAPLVGTIATRSEIMQTADILLLPKPQHADLEEMRVGQTLWGWPHCVQDQKLTQLAVDKKLTLIAFEAMNHWGSDGSFGLHVFHKNNEIAGYASVLHAMQLCGVTGDYGRRLSAVVIGFGATARGAVTALRAHGINEIQVLTSRAVAAVASPIHAVTMVQFEHESGPHLSEVITDEGKVPLAPFLAESDIVVNCTLQDPNAPLMYLSTEQLEAFYPGSIIVDVSCDEGMGFEWARPTSFAEPMFKVGPNINYYAVDHSPSYLWNSASWEISLGLLPFLEEVMGGPQLWKENKTLAHAIEIQDGVVKNPAILEFQKRHAQYPHELARSQA
ncbi:alanine dehydrogenase [Arthrobacter sp. MYb211]|uniref:N(5)-(carboxyethyl)ornithine synthase n=1 Tax=unclassified Arthrobacter TaxID=235627 RepID=UPI000CFAF74D|nr:MULTISPECIES: N(5)-(carboxyethyl)ornithine synthase [unclassified Arthrobacter]PRA10520.1 alanine dehydrogenase [Arthrobacter sp. MYb221]PRC06091.1 alanine dehydrogenase [Arthrobacter sp. MYb211]